ncbi:MAG: ribosome biogenesis GTP-binding protein YihA/YsxC [Candidatus Gracilibacteria bacterium]|nr:ribosome biogenesis GTP-binding protein YihA/YsxC [Candidatus Gracilibacteria bacterium]MDD2909113.1 ribosome biogenesis GTP-binding protein YihA/YsxC [Candidatus Gracilibacteria bacterium]
MEIKEVKFIKSVLEFEKEYSPLKFDIDKKTIFFLGRSNVGKSSMINSILGSKNLAFAGDKPGKTRLINIFEVNKKFECLDFPGYGFAVGSKGNKTALRDMILGYLENNAHRNSKAVMILDAFVGPTSLDEEIYDYLTEKGKKILIILNKTDKTNQKQLSEAKKKVEEAFPEAKYILYSCKTGANKQKAIEEIFS